MSRLRPTTPLSVGGRVAISVVLLLAVGWAVDVGEVLTGLGGLRPGWVVIALLVSVVQVVVLALRWSFTADRLGLDLPFKEALTEYYLGIFLNQVLPGGVTGDVSRAFRHARATDDTGPAVRAVVLERASAQIIMAAVALISVASLPVGSTPVRIGGVALALIALGLALVARLRRAAPDSLAGRIWADTHAALFSESAFAAQLVSGIAVVGSYIGMYLIAALAVGITTPPLTLLPLVAPVLMTMLIPVTVSGWGIREGAAALLWGFAGLTPEDGVTISVAYGLLVLVSSAPGAVILARASSAGRSRTGRPGRDGSDGKQDVTPRPDDPPPAA